MTDLVVIVPSRGRPGAAVELAEAFRLTCTADTQLLLALDSNDLTRPAYPAGLHIKTVGGVSAGWSTEVGVIVTESRSMVEALNLAVQDLLVGGPQPFAIGFMGDDHRPRTRGWDEAYLTELHKLGTGMVYGNDLLQGGNLPTQIAMTSDIPRALGYMAPPCLTHLYVDNYWRNLGQRAGCLSYLKDVTVEHVHPVTGKVEWTPGHRRVNTQEMYNADSHAYNAYVAAGHLAEDVETLSALRRGGG